MILFLLTRLPNLTMLPIFVDEGIHLQWALKLAETKQTFEIIDSGKYLPIWLYSLFIPGVPDPLWAGRFFSVVSGLITILGLIWLGKLLYSSQVGFLAAWFYLILPFTLFYDRMALVDSFLSMLVIYTFIFCIQWFRKGDLFWGVLAGITIGMAINTKVYGILLLIVPIIFIIFLPDLDRRRYLKGIFWIYLLALVAMIPTLMDAKQHIHSISGKLGVTAGGQNNLALIFSNILLSLNWLTNYLTVVGAGLVVLAVFYTIFDHSYADLGLLLFAVIWLSVFIVISRTWYPRYLLPGVVPLLLLAAQRSIQLSKLLARSFSNIHLALIPQLVVVGLLALSSFDLDWAIINDPIQAPWSAIERWQYIEGPAAGYKLDSVVNFLRAEAAENGQLIVVRDRDPGPLQEGLDLNLRQDSAPIITFDIDLGHIDLDELSKQLINQSKPVYFVTDRPIESQPFIDPVGRIIFDLVAIFPKPGDQYQFEIYQVGLP